MEYYNALVEYGRKNGDDCNVARVRPGIPVAEGKRKLAQWLYMQRINKKKKKLRKDREELLQVKDRQGN
jgi:hypothetical protein